MKPKKPIKFQTIGLIGRARLQDKAPFLKKLMDYLEKQKVNIMWDEHLSEYYGTKNEHSPGHILRKSDLVIALGGDGTILKLVRDFPKRKDLYILGINLGNVGFHSEIKDPKKAFKTLDEILGGEYHIDERLLLRVTLYRKGEKISTHLALNDAAINQGNFARLISLRAEVDQRKMITFKGDGLVLATPTGSTGHSLSAGGPIIHPRIDAFIFTPICPSTLSARPIVIPSNRQITITLDTERRFKDNTIGLTIDGQIVITLEYGDQIKVRSSSRKLRFIRRMSSTSGQYYKVLRDKLAWGKMA